MPLNSIFLGLLYSVTIRGNERSFQKEKRKKKKEGVM